MEYRIFGPSGSPPEDFKQDLQGLLTLDEAQKDAIADWFITDKSCDPFASPLSPDIIASSLLPGQFQQIADGLRYLLWAWQEFGLQISDIERDLLLLGFDSRELRLIVPFLERLSTIKQKVWARFYALTQVSDGLPTLDGLNIRCDARAIFGGNPSDSYPAGDSYKKFLGVVPVVILELLISDSEGNTERSAIQLSEERFEWLRGSIERAQEQLTIMKERTAAVAFDGNGLHQKEL